MTICIYHGSDLDGHCSGAIVRRAWAADPQNQPKDLQLYPMDYGHPIPWPLLDGQRVVMVDFSFQPWEQQLLLMRRCEQLRWIDHHSTAIAAATNAVLPTNTIATLVDGRAACELTWEELFPGVAMPRAVQLLGRFDVWDEHNPLWQSQVLPFQYGMRTIEHLPEAGTWDVLLDHGPTTDAMIESLMLRGQAILEYESQQSRAYAKARAFKTTLLYLGRDLQAIGLNRGLCNSRAFDSVWDPQKYQLMIAFCLTPDGYYKVALYTDHPDIDCGQIAQSYGGGGHKKAAGFQTTVLPFVPGGRP